MLRAPFFVGALVAIAAIGAAACDPGSPPDLLGLTDQIAIVGQEMTLELRGVDPDGQNLRYSFAADYEISGRAMITQLPSGSGLFRSFLVRLVAELVVAASGEKDDDGADDNGSVHDLYSHDRS